MYVTVTIFQHPPCIREVKIIAINGYIVLWVNYRGSSDFGEAWQEAIAVNLYFKEYDDLIAAVDIMCMEDHRCPLPQALQFQPFLGTTII